MGENLTIYLTRLQQLLDLPDDALAQVNSPKALISQVAELYPERVAQFPNNTLLLVFEQSQLTYQQQQFPQLSSQSVLLALQLFLGQGILNDPLYPWVTKILNPHLSLSEPERINALIHYAKKRLRKELLMLNKHLAQRPAQDETLLEPNIKGE